MKQNKILKVITMLNLIIPIIVLIFFQNTATIVSNSLASVTSYIRVLIIELINLIFIIYFFKVKKYNKVVILLFLLYIIIIVMIPVYVYQEAVAPTGPHSFLMGLALGEKHYYNLYGIEITQFITP